MTTSKFNCERNFNFDGFWLFSFNCLRFFNLIIDFTKLSRTKRKTFKMFNQSAKKNGYTSQPNIKIN